MEEPPPQVGGAAAAAEGSLLLGAISQTENAVNENSIDGAGGSSEDEAAGPVQELGGVEDESGTEQEEAGEGRAAPAAADGPAAAGAISENGGGAGVPEKRKRGRPRKDAAGAAAGAAAVAAPAKHDAVWAPINVMLPREQHIWEGVMGPTYHGERWRKGKEEDLKALRKTKLFFFEKFIDRHFRETVVAQTNKYVADLRQKPRPSYLPPSL